MATIIIAVLVQYQRQFSFLPSGSMVGVAAAITVVAAAALNGLLHKWRKWTQFVITLVVTLLVVIGVGVVAYARETSQCHVDERFRGLAGSPGQRLRCVICAGMGGRFAVRHAGAFLPVVAGFREGLPVREVVADALLDPGSPSCLCTLPCRFPPVLPPSRPGGPPEAGGVRGSSRSGSLTCGPRCAGRCGKGTGPR